jgi:heme a synthase
VSAVGDADTADTAVAHEPEAIQREFANPMSGPPQNDPTTPRWLHAWAVLTVVAALPLVLLGAEVTTKQVGMADAAPIRTPWHIFTVSLQEYGLGYLIEHSHRVAGWVVGLLTIVLAAGAWFGSRRPLVRRLGVFALVMVVIQGVLGILRVKYNAPVGPEAAMVHGLFAQLVLATLVAAAVVTSRAWEQGTPAPAEAAGLRRLALAVTLLLFVQIIFGGVVRHLHDRLAQRLHVLCAFAVLGAALWLARSVWERACGDRPLRRAANVLLGLVVLQISFGVEAWITRFGAGVPAEVQRPTAGQDAIRSGHFVVGALLFGASVVLTLLAYRPAAVAARPAAGRSAALPLNGIRHAGGVA